MGFNFETIMQAHDVAVRAAVFSHNGEWLLSADQKGIVKYFQQNLNNVREFQAHDEGGGIRGLAFAPTDAKFVTGGDDSTLKVFDFATSTEEMTLTGHQWEVRCVDWHPSKGLLASGSKDHSVKFWDPRSGRCLTTINASKNIVSRAIFEPTRGLYLATSGKDSIIRIFDIRMMRDVFILRGHENDVTSLAWHPIHHNLISSGGHGGAMHHYLLDEQNLPPNMSATLSPYDSPSPETATAQTIYPAHSVLHAHEPTGPIWSLAWHPLGHILASGSNDRITRFWTRARPGDTNCFKDRYHIGQEEAEALGTFSKRDNARQAQAEEKQEDEDELDGLVDQQMPSRLPGLPGLNGDDGAALPGIGGAVAPPPMPMMPGMPPLSANGMPALPPQLPPGFDPSKIDPSRLAEMFGGKMPMPPFPPPPNGALPPPGGLPGQAGMSFPPPPAHLFPNGVPPPGFPPFPLMPGQQGMPPLPGQGGFPPLPVDGAGEGGIRRRAPLPSQKDSLREELHRQGSTGVGRRY